MGKRPNIFEILYVPAVVLGAGNTLVNKTDMTFSSSQSLQLPGKYTINKCEEGRKGT